MIYQRGDDPMEAIKISVRNLVEFVLRCGSIDSRFGGFDRANEGSRIHRKLQKAAGKNYRAEVFFHSNWQVDGINYALEGRADGVIEEDDAYVIDEIKTTAAPTEWLTEDFNPVHWAQAKCYAAFLCEEKQLERVVVQLTYYQVDTDEIIRHRKEFSRTQLQDFLNETLRLYAPWAALEKEWRQTRNESLKALTFPFTDYRPGQYRLARAVYLTICEKGRLFAAAPTGTGKTMSTLFPALKALGESHGERIFYLTAKTITRQAAEDALARLRAHCPGLRLKALTLTAKDKICPMEQRECTPEACPYANGYYDRINEALFRFLNQTDEFTRENILAFSAENHLCPFELALDLSNWCDCIICDYNYLFDPVVSLKRFFTDGGDFVFLIDEAHNLLDRARSMYSAKLSKTAFWDVKKSLGKEGGKLKKALLKINREWLSLREQMQDSENRFLLCREGKEAFVRALPSFTTAAEEWLEEHRDGEVHNQILQLYFEVRFFLKIWEMYDEHFTTLISLFGQDVSLELLCLDPSSFLNDSMKLGRASVLFSATLTPVDYFIETLGGGESAKRILLESPFPQENFQLLTADAISTKYADRQDSLDTVCEMIHTCIHSKKGNYLVFFPSHRYLADVYERFLAQFDETGVLVQQPSMDEEEKEAFLAHFTADSALAGFCVLGGIFSEGVDLPGNRLIGCVIVGVGLPQIGPRQDALRSYYEETRGEGFAYAYQYPGMNKVLQAAGRVIRTEKDRGVILLIDTRYRRADYRMLFPPHWNNARSVRTKEELSSALDAFWNG